jgi:hypothetical protein
VKAYTHQEMARRFAELLDGMVAEKNIASSVLVQETAGR